MNEQISPETKETTDLPDIPESLRRPPVAIEKLPDEPIELERQYVSIEEEGGIESEKTE